MLADENLPADSFRQSPFTVYSKDQIMEELKDYSTWVPDSTMHGLGAWERGYFSTVSFLLHTDHTCSR